MLESAEVALERAKTDEARAHSHVVTARRAFEASRDLERRCLEALETAEAALSGTVEAMSRLGQSVAAVEAEMMHLEQRRQALAEAITFAEAHKNALTDQTEPLQGEEATGARPGGDERRARPEERDGRSIGNGRRAARRERVNAVARSTASSPTSSVWIQEMPKADAGGCPKNSSSGLATSMTGSPH
jgi:chromosome segregation ATPase